MKKQTYYPELKQLSLGILGTAIGVGLTFFANGQVESSHQRSAQRETAIMAVCDIDEIAQGLKEEIYLEDSLFNVTMYVSSNQELIDSLSMDTLDMAFKYLYDDPMVVKEWTADTKENAFNSGIDARMNIGNNQFYDNVQSCYYMRRSLIKMMADAPVFRCPVQKEDYEELLQQLKFTDFNYDGVPLPDARRGIMKKIMAQESTTLYIKRFFARRDAYRKVINELNRLNRENKLLMDITDEDIETYIKKYSGNVTAAASGDLIIGTWEADDNCQMTYIFYKDNTFEQTNHFETNFQIQFVEEHEGQKDQVVDVLVLIPTTIHMEGRWELRGDTLINDQDVNMLDIISFKLDLSNVPQSHMEEVKDSMESNMDMIKQYLRETIKQSVRAQNPEYYVIMFDKTANTMVMTSEETTPTGNKKTNSSQFYRKPE